MLKGSEHFNGELSYIYVSKPLGGKSRAVFNKCRVELFQGNTK